MRLPIVLLAFLCGAIAPSIAVGLLLRGAPQEIACAIRNDGNEWLVLEDEGHRPIRCESLEIMSAPDGSKSLVLRFGVSAKKIHTFIVGADEAFAGVYFAGASVRADLAVISFKDRNGRIVDPAEVYSPWGNFFVRGLVSF